MGRAVRVLLAALLDPRSPLRSLFAGYWALGKTYTTQPAKNDFLQKRREEDNLIDIRSWISVNEFVCTCFLCNLARWDRIPPLRLYAGSDAFLPNQSKICLFTSYYVLAIKFFSLFFPWKFKKIKICFSEPAINIGIFCSVRQPKSFASDFSLCTLSFFQRNFSVRRALVTSITVPYNEKEFFKS